MNSTQLKQVLAYLKQGKTISQAEAIHHFDCYRLSALIRIVLDDSKEPWFCYVDVYKSLGISRTSRLFRELDAKGVADCHILTNGGVLIDSNININRVQ